METQPAPPLTFGVELELVVATLRDDDEDPNPNHRGHVYGLTHSDIDQTYDFDYGSGRHRLRNLQRNMADILESKLGFQVLCADEAKFKPYSTWEVSTDVSVIPEDTFEEGYTCYPIEIISPVLTLNEASVTEIRRVCETISSSFRVELNSTCGLHVHVGSKKRGFPFDVVRKFMAIYWTFEPQIESIHPQHRLESTWCPGIRTCHLAPDNINELAEQAGKSKERIILDLILASTNVINLGVLTGTLSKGCAASIGRLDRIEGGIKTVEFRQHKPTLDPDTVINWATFCVRLIEAARDADLAKLAVQLHTFVDLPVESFSLTKLLRSPFINLPEVAEYYEIESLKEEIRNKSSGASESPTGQGESVS